MLTFLTAGESHGRALMAIVEGMPAGLPLEAKHIDVELKRRQMGYGRGQRMKIESDHVQILSGVRYGKTLGSPIALMIENNDWQNWQQIMSLEKPGSTSPAVTRPRPGHADLAGSIKYDQHDVRNILERASARETAARVAVGALAKRLLGEFHIFIGSHVVQIGPVRAKREDIPFRRLLKMASGSPVGCADKEAAEKMMAEIDRAKGSGDSLGGICELRATGCPPGLGSHVHWDRRLDARLSFALMSIPGVKGVEIGLGFAAASQPGSRVDHPG